MYSSWTRVGDGGRVDGLNEPQGFKQLHKNKVVTVFSAPNYCYYVGNKGAYAETDELGYLSLYSVY